MNQDAEGNSVAPIDNDTSRGGFMMGTDLNKLQRYMSRGTCYALLSVLAICMLAAFAQAQPAVPIVVSQTTWGGAFPGGGVLSQETVAGNSWGMNSDGVLVASTTYGNNIIQFAGAGYPATVAGPYTNAGSVAIDSSNFLYVSGQYSNVVIKVPMGTVVNGTFTASPNGTYTWALDPGNLPTGTTIPACTGVAKTDETTGECEITSLTASSLGYFGVSAMAFDAAGDLFFATDDQGDSGGQGPAYSIYECVKTSKATTDCLYGTGTVAPVLLYAPSVTPAASLSCTATPAVGQIYIGGLALDQAGDLFFTDSNICKDSNQSSVSSSLNELAFNVNNSTYSSTVTTLETLTNATPGQYDDEIDAVYVNPSSGTVYFGAANSGIYALSNNSGTVDTSSLYAISDQGTKLLQQDAYGNLFAVGYSTVVNTNGIDTFNYIGLGGPTFPGTATTASILVADNSEPCTPSLLIDFSNTEFTAGTAGTCSSSSLGDFSFVPYTITLAPVAGVAPTTGMTVTDSTSEAVSSTIGKSGVISSVDQSTWLQPFIGGGAWGSANSGGTSGGINSMGVVVLGDSYATGAGVQQFTAAGTVAPTVAGPVSNIAAVAVDSNNFLYADGSYNQNIIKVPMSANGTYSFTVDPGGSSFTSTSVPMCVGTSADSAGECLMPVSTGAVTFGGGGAMTFDANGDMFFATNMQSGNAESIYYCAAGSACLYAATPNPVQLFEEPPANKTTGDQLLVGGLAVDSNQNLYFTDVMVAGTGSEYNLYTDVYEIPYSPTNGYAASPTLLETLTIACDAAPCDYNNEIDGISTDANGDVFFADQYTGIYEIVNNSGTLETANPVAIAAPGAKIIVPDGKGNFYFAGYHSGDSLGYDLVGQAAFTGFATASSPTSASIYVMDDFGCDLAPALSYSFADTTDTFAGTSGSTENLTFGGGCGISATLTFTPAASTSGTVDTTMAVSDTQNGGTLSGVPITAIAATAQLITFTNPTGSETIPYSTTPIVLAATGGASGNAVTFAVTSGPGTLAADGVTLTINGVGAIVITASQAGAVVDGVTYAAGSATITITVTPAPQTITFTPPASAAYGTTLTLSATGGDSGNAVTFTVASGPGTLAADGVTLSITGIGPIVVDANQAASTNGDYAAATQVAATITAVQASQTITFTPPASVPFSGTPITLSATGGASENPVTFTLVSGPGTLSGTNNDTLTITGLGSIVIDANQAGNTDYAAAAQVQATIVVAALGTVATPAISPASGSTLVIGTSSNVTITDATAGATIYYTTDGSNPLTSETAAVYPAGGIPIPATANPAWVVTAAATEAGWTASASATATYNVTTVPPNFTMSESTSTVTITPTEPANIVFTLSGVGGFNSAISFACINPPTNVTCSFSPSTVTPNGNAPVTTTLTVSDGGSAALEHRSNPFFPAGGAALAAAFCFLGWKKRRGLLLALILIAGAIGVTQLTGCAGGGVSNKTITTSNMFVTATGGSAVQTLRITVNVQK
jgi:Chitobiase/beta-hexosaminidase C-terminal domain